MSVTLRRAPLPLLAVAVVAAVVAVVPIVYLVDRAGSLGWARAWSVVVQERTLELATRSLVLGLVVTAACVVVGVVAAWLVVCSDVPGRRIWQAVLVLPLAVPSYAAAYAWVSWRPTAAPFPLAVLVLTLVSYPFVFLPVAAALRRLDPAQEEVARTAGWGPAGVALRLTLRQVRPAIAAGALLVLLYVLADFGAVAVVRYEVFTFVIYGAYNAGFDPTLAAVLSLVLVVLAVVVVAAEGIVRGSPAYARLGSGAARRRIPVRLGLARGPATGILAVVVSLGVGFPAWRFVHWSVRALGTDVDWADVGAALGNSLWWSLLAAAATTLLAVPVGVLAARYRSLPVRATERATYVAHALPGIVVGIAMVAVGVAVLRPVYQEVPLLVVAYVVLFLPLAVATVRAGVEQVPVRQEEVARGLGLRPWAVLWRVTVPGALPAVLGGAALVYVTAMKELPVTLLLHPTGSESLATRLWTYTAETNYAAGAPYVLGLVLFAAVPTVLLSRFVIDRTGRADVVL